jgi:hypothetical protein
VYEVLFFHQNSHRKCEQADKEYAILVAYW